ncbi:hypothetical protein [Niastella populi]|uniref:Thioesterase domain-containing protein n=1 Tax=Niastella populi TaxID=550983 RepID=A0A1V9GDZ3_9BACT|nr:hypothetical protein [Niastella populi]OQP68646.1 hypothetical protein A4R26_02290 [Niastella populi]
MNLFCFTGDEEDISDEEINAWQQETMKEVEMKKLPGKHFFIFDHPEEIMQVINSSLGNKT